MGGGIVTLPCCSRYVFILLPNYGRSIFAATDVEVFLSVLVFLSIAVLCVTMEMVHPLTLGSMIRPGTIKLNQHTNNTIRTESLYIYILDNIYI